MEREKMRPTSSIRWTNSSVRLLAGEEDPVAIIERMVRTKVLEALDAGWAGPPFNPLFLADLMKIPVEPDSSVPDARTVPGNGGIKIQFNPTQARERLRFSIAHEITHALFPDVAEAIRNRGSTPRGTDDWQLEMLCNIGAAEFIMPIGSLLALDSLPPLEKLMVDRRSFDVSTEAYLMRVVKVSTQPVAMFCASPIISNNAITSYRVDYIVVSRTWTTAIRAGATLPAESVVGNCIAAGQTTHGVLSWPGVADLSVECVGMPAYPGDLYPRVAGLIRAEHGKSKELISYVHGDIFKSRNTEPKIICQLVNDKARIWGGGIAKTAARKFPDAQASFSAWFQGSSPLTRLGAVHFADLGSGQILASLVAQHGYGPSEHPRIRYAALQTCLSKVGAKATDTNSTVHMPKLGTGGAGADWQRVEELILDEIVERGCSVTVYDLPPPRQGPSADLLS